ncbi:MAG: hypothetical protein SCM57_07510, partial [Bacillota bacterium]|nr:hypothetical protein [Bacillota bacterium]
TLAEALAAVFGLQPGVPPEEPPDDDEEPGRPVTPGEPVEGTVLELIEQAVRLFSEAEAAQRSGDWAEYGRLQQELGAVLARLQELGTTTE